MEIPNYVLLKKIGEGAMAEVYLAEHKRNRRRAAIKVLKISSQVSATDAEALFLREGEVLASFSDRNIVAIYDNDKVGDIAYLAMEFLTGGTLLERMQRGPIQVGEAIGFIVQVATALNTAHAAGVIHRDLKPANIMLRDETTPVLTDFGAARLLDKSTIYGKDGSIIGTPYYMSPEQIQGLDLDGRSDEYALGVLFYELLTGKLPFGGQTAQEVGMQHLFAPIPTLPASLAMLQPVLTKMLAKSRDDRYASTLDVVDALRRSFLSDDALRLQVNFDPNSAWSSQLRALGFLLDTSARNEIRIAQGQALQNPPPPTAPQPPVGPPRMATPPAQPPAAPAAPPPVRAASAPPPVRPAAQPAPPPMMASASYPPQAPKKSGMGVGIVIGVVVTAFIGFGLLMWAAAVYEENGGDSGDGTQQEDGSNTPPPGPTDGGSGSPSGSESGSGTAQNARSSTGTTSTASSFFDKLVDGSNGPAMIYIPAGEFSMGSPADDPRQEKDELPQHNVTLRMFGLSRDEITVAEFRRFVEASGYRTEAEQGIDLPDSVDKTYQGPNPGCYAIESAANFAFAWRGNRDWKQPGFPQGDNHPVVCISWNDAVAYSDWLSSQTGQAYRLPSEAELEYVERGGTQTIFPWGNDDNAGCKHANGADKTPFADGGLLNPRAECKDGQVFTAPVGSHSANWFGINDSIGNVWEWAADCVHSTYDGAPDDGSAWVNTDGSPCPAHILRGGSWADAPVALRPAHRNWVYASDRRDYYGFRVARDVI